MEDGSTLGLEIKSDNAPYPRWKASQSVAFSPRMDDSVLSETIETYFQEFPNDKRSEELRSLFKTIAEFIENSKKVGKKTSLNLDAGARFFSHIFSAENLRHPDFQSLRDFLVYSPENSSLRLFESESQIEPLGINGEGLLRLLFVMASESDGKSIREISQHLRIFSWFDGLAFRSSSEKPTILIRDTFVSKTYREFDYRSANEGFLFVLFYITLFVSKLTPQMFSIDNVDASLNPKLCARLATVLAALTEEKGKQVLLTTHNPAFLDGLNLNDDEQRLFVVSRGPRGRTRVRRIERKGEGRHERLSQLFIDGLLGGLPKNF